MRISPRPGIHVAHRNLKPGMVVLTLRGWRTVNGLPEECGPHARGLKLRVPFVGGEAAIEDPGHLWVRRIHHPIT